MDKPVSKKPASPPDNVFRLCLQSALEDIDSPAFFLDRNYCYISFNKAHADVMRQLYGTKIKQGLSLLECMTIEEDRVTTKRNIDHTLKHGEKLVTEVFTGDERLSRRYVEITQIAIKDNDGSVIGVGVTGYDITDRKLAAAAETRYRELFDHISSCVAVYEAVDNGSDFIIRDFNRAACASDQINREDVLGRSVKAVFPGVIDFGIFQVFQRVWESGLPEYFPISKYKDARISGWRENYIYKLPSGEIVAVYTDVTEQKRLLDELELTNQRLETALHGADLGLYDNNIKTGAAFFNDHYFRMLGYEPGEMDFNLDHFFKLVHPDDRPGLTQTLLDFLKTNTKELIHLEYRMRHKSGHWIWVMDRGRIVGWDEEGNASRIAGTHVDITPRKQADLALRQSEEKYRNIFENATEGIFQSTPEGKYITVNPAFAKMAGYDSPEDMISSITNIGRQLYAHVEDREYLKQLFQNFGYVRDFIAEIKRKDGSVLWISINAKTVRGEDGKILYYEGTILDITERKLAEEALKESERAYRDIFEAAPIGIINSTIEGRLLAANSALAEMLGYGSPGELVAAANNSGIADAFYADPDQRLHILENTIRSTGWPQYEVDFKRKDGSIITCLLQLRVVKKKKNNNGIDHLEGFIQDITGRKRALEALERQREEYRTIFDSVPASIVYVDGKGTFLRVNRPAASALGYTPKQIVGKHISDIFPADEAALFSSMHNEVLTTGTPLIGSINKFTTSTGEIRWGQNDIVPYFDSNGKIIGTIIFSEDITDRMKAEHGLKLSYEALHRALQGSVDAIAKMVEMKDPYTAGHQARVAELAVAIAREMGLSEERVDYIQTAARMHDVGKIYVPSDILSKPGSLSKIEFEIIKTHAQGSYEILKSIDFPGPVAQIALQHHERLNGSGYPHGISDTAIIEEARILAVADVVEAMISYRPYRPALGIEKALAEIKQGNGSLYDAGAVDACIRLFEEKKFIFAVQRAF